MFSTSLRIASRSRVFSPASTAARSFASSSSPINSLVLIEHRSGDVEGGTLAALTAASELGGKVTGLVVGSPGEVEGIVEKVKKLNGVTNIITSTSDEYKHQLAESVTPLLKDILEKSEYTHLVSAHTSAAKDIIPRLSGILDIPAISDVLSASHSESDGSTTYTRPIYAGNAIATVKAPGSLKLKIFTVRSTAFAKAAEGNSASVEVATYEPLKVEDIATSHLKTELAKSDRPELGTAARVVSGGRALKNAETFKQVIDPLADALGAAVGASRAAVDAGYVDNSLQVGQTGKVVAPELYVAVGISGAIQHLAGMKDSKLIVAINKDPDAPIFQVADAGLVADLYEAVPQLVKKLEK
ncbi:electron transfer flavoprotein alpha subunit [Clavulina sp. PMI_390]|nr:electron transfer flavoprotein alpha subunit [Clavulina sp. PMI_390]